MEKLYWIILNFLSYIYCKICTNYIKLFIYIILYYMYMFSTIYVSYIHMTYK